MNRGALLWIAGAAIALAACDRPQSRPSAQAATVDTVLDAGLDRRVTVRGRLATAESLSSGSATIRVTWDGDGPSPLGAWVGREVTIEGRIGREYVVLDPRAVDGAFQERSGLVLIAWAARVD